MIYEKRIMHEKDLSLQRIMRRVVIILGMLFSFHSFLFAQEIEENDILPYEPLPYKLKLQRYRYVNPIIEKGDTMWCYLLPELPVYPPLVFKNERQRREYNKLIYNVKRVLPLAQRVNSMIAETYEVLESLPDQKTKEQHIRDVEKSIKEQYTPEMKKLTYSQGKLLIKLVDRECNQNSYEIVKAFFGPAKAAFYQVFAWTFRASLKKEYRPEDDDKLIERVVCMVETGQL